LFRRALAKLGFCRRPRLKPLPIDRTRGRSLLRDPNFLALARAYEETVKLPPRATLRDVFKGHWYAIAVVPGRERTAMARVADETWLPTYVPGVQYIGVARGRLINVRRALFTGYGFVCVADIDKFFSQIRWCDGVLGILCENGEPVPIYRCERPAQFVKNAPKRPTAIRFDHELIEYIRAVERDENWSLATVTEKSIASVTPPAPRPNRRRTSKQLKKAKAKARKAKRKAKASPVPQAEAA
jgi:transcription antitermination factor NusG